MPGFINTRKSPNLILKINILTDRRERDLDLRFTKNAWGFFVHQMTNLKQIVKREKACVCELRRTIPDPKETDYFISAAVCVHVAVR